MTVMQDREKRLNLNLAIGLSLAGTLIWVLGMTARVQEYLLPDYADVLRLGGGTLTLLGLIWALLTLLRTQDAIRNLIISSLLSLAAMILWMAARWAFSAEAVADYQAPLAEAARNTLVVGLVWLFLACGKLIITAPPTKVNG